MRVYMINVFVCAHIGETEVGILCLCEYTNTNVTMSKYYLMSVCVCVCVRVCVCVCVCVQLNRCEYHWRPLIFWCQKEAPCRLLCSHKFRFTDGLIFFIMPRRLNSERRYRIIVRRYHLRSFLETRLLFVCVVVYCRLLIVDTCAPKHPHTNLTTTRLTHTDSNAQIYLFMFYIIVKNYFIVKKVLLIFYWARKIPL